VFINLCRLKDFILLIFIMNAKYYLSIIFFFVSIITNSQSVYRTPSGTKYHLSTCRMIKNVSHKISYKQAAELGLLPCKICSPRDATAQGFARKTKVGSKEAKGESKTKQCIGQTKKRMRCKHRTRNVNGYCAQHDPK
jgi:hypothetical protein